MVLPLSSGKPLVMRRSGPPAVCASMAVSNVLPSLQGNFFQEDSISFLFVCREMGYASRTGFLSGFQGFTRKRQVANIRTPCGESVWTTALPPLKRSLSSKRWLISFPLWGSFDLIMACDRLNFGEQLS